MSLMEKVATERGLIDENQEDAACAHLSLMALLKAEYVSISDRLVKLNHVLASLEMPVLLREHDLSSISLYVTAITTGCDYDAQSYAIRADSRIQELSLLEKVAMLLKSHP